MAILENIILILAVCGIFYGGYRMMAQLDTLLDEIENTGKAKLVEGVTIDTVSNEANQDSSIKDNDKCSKFGHIERVE